MKVIDALKAASLMVWLGVLLVSSLFTGLMIASAGGAIHTPLYRVAAPFACDGEFTVESQRYSYKPGQSGVEHKIYCRDKATGARTEITFYAIFIAFLIYSGLTFVVFLAVTLVLIFPLRALARRAETAVGPVNLPGMILGTPRATGKPARIIVNGQEYAGPEEMPAETRSAYEGAAGALDRIEREAERLNEMIGQLLALARWESGADGPRREPVELARLVRDVAEDADYEAKAAGRAVRLSRADGCRAEGTPTLLRSAVENVVRNAVRHTPEGTEVEVSLEFEGGAGGGSQAVIRVRDCGAGVPPDALADIFRPFYRVDDARDRASGGTGLGLAITERAVRMHGGTVSAANAPGGGLAVQIRLPAARV